MMTSDNDLCLTMHVQVSSKLSLVVRGSVYSLHFVVYVSEGCNMTVAVDWMYRRQISSYLSNGLNFLLNYQ